MDDFTSLEEVIIASSLSSGSNLDADRKIRATKYLESLRHSSDRWSVGLKLFSDSKGQAGSAITFQFFGLSLVRDFLTNFSVELTQSSEINIVAIVSHVRDMIAQWLMCSYEDERKTVGNITPVFNNAVSIMTLCIKVLYPEHWPAAFADLLQMNIDVITGVMKELEIEVVMFQDGRSKNEIIHNTLIKDSMRGSRVIEDVLRHLCEFVAVSTHRGEDSQRSVNCLQCLSELVGWTDLSLFMTVSLPVLNAVLQSLLAQAQQRGSNSNISDAITAQLQAAVFSCYLELVKKGMDPVEKVQLLSSIRLVDQLSFWCEWFLDRCSGVEGEGDSDLLLPLEKLGLLTELIVVELLGCWCKFEDAVFALTEGAQIDGTSFPPLQAASVLACAMLHKGVPIAVRLLGHPSTQICCSVVGACNKLISVLRSQQKRVDKIQSFLLLHPSLYPSTDSNPPYFKALDFLNPLLACIYRQMQYSEDFDFDAAEAFESDEAEAKMEVRKLFVNCCRVYPERCLELIVAVLCSFPQPWSKVPFPPLEAAFRLVFAFSECGGNVVNKMVMEGQFPALISSIQQTDVLGHPNRQVKLMYFEVSVRYFKAADVTGKGMVVSRLVGPQGMRSSDDQVRRRCPYLFLKVVESMDGSSHVLLSDLSLGRSLLELFSGPLQEQESDIGEEAEVHLLEALSLLVSSANSDRDRTASEGTGPIVEQQRERQQYQLVLLQQLLQVLTNQIHTLGAFMLSQGGQFFTRMQAPSDEQGLPPAVRLLAHRIHNIASLCRGFGYRTYSCAVDVFESAFVSVFSALRLSDEAHSPLNFDAVKAKSVVLTHKMLLAVGPRCLQLKIDDQPMLGVFLQALLLRSDLEYAPQLLNQIMVEFNGAALQLVVGLLPTMLDGLTRAGADADASSTVVTADAPHMKLERAALRRQLLLLLQHVCTHGCQAVFYCTPFHEQYLQTTLDVTMSCMEGTVLCQNPADADTSLLLPLQRAAMIIISSLSKAWLHPAEAAEPPVSAHLQDAFRNFLWAKAMPTILRAICDAHIINIRDANAQGVLAEIAAFFWTISAKFQASAVAPPSLAELEAFVEQTASAVGWPTDAARRLASSVSGACASPLGTFKETFKQMLRSSTAGV